MTADKANKSLARTNLDFVLGRARVSLGALLPEEFDEFLEWFFGEIELRSASGFTSLHSLLTRTPGSYAIGRRHDPAEHVTMKPVIMLEGYLESDFSLSNTHVAKVCRGVLEQVVTYRRHESDEETTDWNVAQTWFRDGYTYRVDNTILVIRRTKELYQVRYIYEKVPHKDEMSIGFVEARSPAQELQGALRSSVSSDCEGSRAGTSESYRPNR